MEGGEITQKFTDTTQVVNESVKKKIFVAGATGSTGKRIVRELLSREFEVKAGVRDLDKAKTVLSDDNPALQIVSFIIFSIQNFSLNWVNSLSLNLLQVKADVTEGSAKLSEAIGDDSEAVICATGFKPGWDLFAPWKVNYLLIHLFFNTVDILFYFTYTVCIVSNVPFPVYFFSLLFSILKFIQVTEVGIYGMKLNMLLAIILELVLCFFFLLRNQDCLLISSVSLYNF